MFANYDLKEAGVVGQARKFLSCLQIDLLGCTLNLDACATEAASVLTTCASDMASSENMRPVCIQDWCS